MKITAIETIYLFCFIEIIYICFYYVSPILTIKIKSTKTPI